MSLEIRIIEVSEYEAWMRAVARAFAGHSAMGGHITIGGHLAESDCDLRRPIVEVDRCLATFDGNDIVGTMAAYTAEISIPGASIAVAVIDDVSVQPTHRRRGILTRLMDRQLKDLKESGVPLAALIASQSIIYHRFGYAIGSLREDWMIKTEHGAFLQQAEQRGEVQFVDPQEARSIFPVLFEREYEKRQGMIKQSSPWWDLHFTDPEHWRGGAGGYYHVLCEEQNQPAGYATYRINGNALVVRELLATTDDAYANLWRFCLEVDLMSSIEATGRALDEPLPWMLADPRQLRRSVRDQIWLRLVDVPTALSARCYNQTDRLVLEVRDSFCSWNTGCYELQGGPNGAQCRPTNASPDLVISVSDLTATYLGAVGFETLARAGVVQENTSNALRRAEDMFATRRLPWTPSF